MKLKEFMHRCEDEYIRKLLDKHKGNVRAAAIEAGCHRAHVYRVMHRCNIRRRRWLHREGNEAWRALGALERKAESP